MAHKIIQDFKERRNAKKFKHQKGGTIRCDDGTILQKSNLTKDQLSGRTPVIEIKTELICL